jgi:hypothetical protein
MKALSSALTFATQGDTLKRIVIAIPLCLVILTSAMAQNSELNLQLVPQGENAPAGEPGVVATLRVRCYTNSQDCHGRAYFKNTDSTRYASYAVFYDNGRRGRSNFVLPPGDDHWMSGIRYNDTYASVWGSSGVPDNAQRSYIYVCCE